MILFTEQDKQNLSIGSPSGDIPAPFKENIEAQYEAARFGTIPFDTPFSPLRQMTGWI